MDEASYDALVDVRNTNREEEAVEGRGLDEAVRALETLTTAGSDPASADAHPERRRKAAWQAFQDSELPKLKEEKPGLKRQQARRRRRRRRRRDVAMRRRVLVPPLRAVYRHALDAVAEIAGQPCKRRRPRCSWLSLARWGRDAPRERVQFAG